MLAKRILCAVRPGLFAIVSLFLMALPSAGHAQGVVKETHGFWELRCNTPPGALNEQCFLLQFVAADDIPELGLSVIIVQTADLQTIVMRVVAPLGILLPEGLGLRIDGVDMGRVQFVRCPREGCMAEVIIDEAMLNRLKAGKTATFVLHLTVEEGIGVPISLDGFIDGYNALLQTNRG